MLQLGILLCWKRPPFFKIAETSLKYASFTLSHDMQISLILTLYFRYFRTMMRSKNLLERSGWALYSENACYISNNDSMISPKTSICCQTASSSINYAHKVNFRRNRSYSNMRDTWRKAYNTPSQTESLCLHAYCSHDRGAVYTRLRADDASYVGEATGWYMQRLTLSAVRRRHSGHGQAEISLL